MREVGRGRGYHPEPEPWPPEADTEAEGEARTEGWPRGLGGAGGTGPARWLAVD